MNNKIRNFIERLSIVLWAQIYSMLISGVTAFIMPKYFSIQAYSYYQLENLYCGYIWIISLGIPNGFFLKYGGKKRGEFNKSEITSQVAVYTMYIVLISILLIVTALIFGKDASKKFVFILSVIITAHEIIFNIPKVVK